MRSSLDSRLRDIHQLNMLQMRDQWVNRLHPLVKLLLTIFFLVFEVSVDKYALSKTISFAIYPIMIYQMADLNMTDALKQLKIVLPLVLAVGIFNPFFDRAPLLIIGTFPVTG